MTNSSIKNPSIGEGLGGLTLNEYQKQAMTTCMESSNNFSYMMLNLVGEVGEFASKVAKGIRKGHICIGEDVSYGVHAEANELTSRSIDQQFDPEFEDELKKEAGDILWQLSGLCSVMGWSLDDIAQQNLEKLTSRQERNVIDGNGDNR